MTPEKWRSCIERSNSLCLVQPHHELRARNALRWHISMWGGVGIVDVAIAGEAFRPLPLDDQPKPTDTADFAVDVKTCARCGEDFTYRVHGGCAKPKFCLRCAKG